MQLPAITSGIFVIIRLKAWSLAIIVVKGETGLETNIVTSPELWYCIMKFGPRLIAYSLVTDKSSDICDWVELCNDVNSKILSLLILILFLRGALSAFAIAFTTTTNDLNVFHTNFATVYMCKIKKCVFKQFEKEICVKET